MTLNCLTRQKITVKYSKDTDIDILDYCIDGRSLQETLKARYVPEFQHGRFREFWLPILGRSDCAEKINGQQQQQQICINIPHEHGKEIITPLYGCHDNCCIYLFVKVCRKNDNIILWNKIGRNMEYIKNNNNENHDEDNHDNTDNNNNIAWLPDFEPILFDFQNYQNIRNQLGS